MDDSRVRVLMDEARKDRLFVEGERDAARDDLAIVQDHLEAANNAHMEAEKDLASAQATIDRLTIQRDAAEALARETQTALVKAVALAIDNARQIDEALAILRAFVAAEDTQLVKAQGSGAAHLGFGMYVDAMDRARKLVGP